MYLFLLFRLIDHLMPTQISEIISCLNEHAPFALAEPWDNVGLLVGDRFRTVTSVLIGLDPTSTLAEEAINRGADTIITHHPLIFKPLPTIDTATPTGRFIEMVIARQISVIACHTNLDSAATGVSDALGRAIGIERLQPLVPNAGSSNPEHGMGRIGILEKPCVSKDFLRILGKALDLKALSVIGQIPEIISSVAICGGSGSDLAPIARDRGADLFITAEIKHNVARWAEEHGFCMIEGTHYATERYAINLLYELLEKEQLSRGWGITVSSTTTEFNPFVLTYID
jgi:dinuclear metal center YbgI/SA1388 family protein